MTTDLDYPLPDGRYLDSVRGRLVDSPTPTPPEARRVRLLTALLSPPRATTMVVVPTWACNLRCPYCFVNDRLAKGFADVDEAAAARRAGAARDFAARLDARYGPRPLSATFLGGEPLLGMPVVEAYLRELPARFGMTSNLAVDLEDRHLAALLALDHLAVTVDGDAEAHDKLRPIYRHPDNPASSPEGGVHAKVMANLKVVLAAGFDPKKLTVQGAGGLLGEARLRDFLYDLFALGVLPENAKLGSLAPTAKFAVEDFKVAATMKPRPCCDFRWMENFVLDGDTLRASYFHDDPARSLLGPIGSGVRDVEGAYAAIIEATMPALGDANCVACPVVGLCWGHCRGHLKDDTIRPSSVCDQAGLIALKDEMLREDPAKLVAILGAGEYGPASTPTEGDEK